MRHRDIGAFTSLHGETYACTGAHGSAARVNADCVRIEEK